MNHVTHLDWMFLWSLVDRQGDISYWKPITKNMLRQVPIIGMLLLIFTTCSQMTNGMASLAMEIKMVGNLTSHTQTVPMCNMLVVKMN